MALFVVYYKRLEEAHMEEIRVNPDKLLETIRREDEKQQSGHLKIFFGYAAGVGKTYTMLNLMPGRRLWN